MTGQASSLPRRVALLASVVVLGIFALRSLPVPTACDAIAEVYRSFGKGAGYATWEDFLAAEIAVEKGKDGRALSNTVTYPNPRVSSVVGHDVATRVYLRFSLIFGKTTYQALDIPLEELHGTTDFAQVCQGQTLTNP